MKAEEGDRASRIGSLRALVKGRVRVCSARENDAVFLGGKQRQTDALLNLPYQVFLQYPIVAVRAAVLPSVPRIQNHGGQGRLRGSNRLGGGLLEFRRRLDRSRGGLQNVCQEGLPARSQLWVEIQPSGRGRDNQLRHTILVVKLELAHVRILEPQSLLGRLDGLVPQQHYPLAAFGGGTECYRIFELHGESRPIRQRLQAGREPIGFDLADKDPFRARLITYPLVNELTQNRGEKFHGHHPLPV